MALIPTRIGGGLMLKLFNSMGRKMDEFRPREVGRARVFTCGPSIYRRPHIGNYRSFLYEDVLVRYLEYVGLEVDRTINFTDVEDKSITEADAQGRDVLELTEEVSRHFFEECRLLRMKLPHEVPRSSTTIDETARIIKKLVDDGYAYWHQGNVYFDPLKKKDFGKLFGLDMSKWPKKKVRFHKDTYNGQRWNRGDFILWHGNRNGEPPFWDTEIGRGRPSWNVQDPGIIVKHLGDWIDINCGGIDNIYRHHDYNVAVMEAYTGKEFAHYYLHGAHLIVDGKPMSKSKGNILYPENVLDKGYEGYHLRFFLTHRHYRRRLNFTWARMQRAAATLDAFRTRVQRLTTPGAGTTGDERISRCAGDIPTLFEKHMGNDLHLGDAFDAIAQKLESVDPGEKASVGEAAAHELEETLRIIDSVFQFIF
jgi:cysteinyl-tRNA synthetase